ncbi:MAG: MBL fold metallo-hydrolase [Bacteroidota bacterium]|nr:MBL fold metallo-hydrolase [Bacteroidota bacterium]
MSTALFWDVQHGHATTVISPNHRVFVVDLGQGSYTSDNSFSPLNSLYHCGYQTIDHLIISHPHLDHIDDILQLSCFNVLSMIRPQHLEYADVMNGISDVDKPKYDCYWSMHERYVWPVSPENDTTVAANFGGLTARIFAPRKCARSNLNNHSIVTVFEEGPVRVVVPGDNEACSFAELLKMPDFCAAVANADVLLAPHHGRKAGTCAEFLKLVNPRLCVISDGRATGTNAVGEYSKAARGLNVRRRSGGSRLRRCLSTRKDGMIKIRFGQGITRPYLDVEIN